MSVKEISYSEYHKLTDEELIGRFRDGESRVMDYICDKYKDMVRGKAKSMFILGGDNEDLIQEGMIGLFKAVRDYDSGRDASFYTFADLCVSRQIYTAVQASRRKKHLPLNTSVSLQSFHSDGEESGNEGLDAFLAAAQQSPEEVVLDKERLAYLEEAIDRELSALEKQVLDLYLTGMGYVQIARVLGRDEKSTDNALQRLKAKIRKISKNYC